MWAVVPLKSPERAKTRLAGALSAVQRHHLLFELGERVIRALQGSCGIEAVAVVTASTEVAAFASALGAQTIFQKEEIGTAAAFAAALRELQPLNLKSILMIAGDLPLVTTAAIERLILARNWESIPAPIAGSSLPLRERDRERGQSICAAPTLPPSPQPSPIKGEGVKAKPRARLEVSVSAIVVPDRHRIGTNALLCSPPQVIPPCFGGDSFRRHLAAAEQAGVSARVMEIDELALDLDCAADLDELRFRSQSAAASIIEPPIRRFAGVSR